jgi:hypothetical protein
MALPVQQLDELVTGGHTELHEDVVHADLDGCGWR